VSTRDQAIVRVANKIKDLGTGVDRNVNVALSDTEIGETVDEAVTQYSVDNPRIVTFDLAMGASPFVDTSTITGWVVDWSQLLAVEPDAAAVSATYTPSQLGDLTREIQTDYRDTTKTYFYYRSSQPASGSLVRYTFTAPHTLSAVLDTIPTPHFDAVCDLAASYCCLRLATKAAGATDATIQADAVTYRDSQLRYRQCAEDFRASYKSKVGVQEPGMRPASFTSDFDVMLSSGLTRLSHPGYRIVRSR
jgi:hypothetical protein